VCIFRIEPENICWSVSQALSWITQTNKSLKSRKTRDNPTEHRAGTPRRTDIAVISYRCHCRCRWRWRCCCWRRFQHGLANVAATVVRRRRRRRWFSRWPRTDVVGDHHEASVASPGCGQQGRPTAATATAVHVTGRPAAECGRCPTPRRVRHWHHGGQRPVQVAVRRKAGSGHAPAPGRHTGQRTQQQAGLVRTVSIYILLKLLYHLFHTRNDVRNVVYFWYELNI